MQRDICSVTVRFAREPGGPRLSAAEIAEWVEAKLAGREPEGSNGLRYASARVTALSIMEER